MNDQLHYVHVNATNGHRCAGHLTKGVLDHQIHVFLARFDGRGWCQSCGGSNVTSGDEHGELAICIRSSGFGRRQLSAVVKKRNQIILKSCSVAHIFNTVFTVV